MGFAGNAGYGPTTKRNTLLVRLAANNVWGASGVTMNPCAPNPEKRFDCPRFEFKGKNVEPPSGDHLGVMTPNESASKAKIELGVLGSTMIPAEACGMDIHVTPRSVDLAPLM